METQIRKLALRKGDILIIEKGFSVQPHWQEILRTAAKEAGLEFNVPVVFVDDIDQIAMLRLGHE